MDVREREWPWHDMGGEAVAPPTHYAPGAEFQAEAPPPSPGDTPGDLPPSGQAEDGGHDTLDPDDREYDPNVKVASTRAGTEPAPETTATALGPLRHPSIPNPTLTLPVATIIITASASPSSASSHTPVGAIVGGILGFLAFVALLGAGFWFLRRRRRRYAPLRPLPREARPLVQPFESEPGPSDGIRKSMTDTVLVPTERSVGFSAPRARDSMDVNQLNQVQLQELAQRQLQEMEMDTPGAGPSRPLDGGDGERYDPPAYASWPH